MILAVYGDDSADRGRENVLTVGAFMGFPSMFIDAETKWAALLKKNNLEYFKASECQARDGQFHPNRLMMDPRAAQTHSENIRHELGKILIEEQLGGIAVSLEMKAFRKVIAEQPDGKEYFSDDPYIYMFKRLIIDCIHRMNVEHPEDPIKSNDIAYQMLRTMPLAFVFDDHSHWREAEQSYEMLRRDPYISLRLGSISHANDKQVIALQMADLCAYEARYKTMADLGLVTERNEFTRMANKHAFYAISIVQECHLLEELEAGRKLKGTQP